MKNIPAERTVIGHPSCPRFITDIAKQAEKWGKDRPVGIVLPPVMPEAEQILEKILDRIRCFDDVEITANDWGTLAHLCDWKRKYALRTVLIMGILLSGQESDPAIRNFTDPQDEHVLWIGSRAVLFQWTPPMNTLVEYWSEPAAFHMTKLLSEMGVDAVEIGLQPVEIIDNSQHLPVRNVPYGLMSVRPCRGECSQCGGKEIIRAGHKVYFDRNMLKWE